jgi:hypothetical protein
MMILSGWPPPDFAGWRFDGIVARVGELVTRTGTEPLKKANVVETASRCFCANQNIAEICVQAEEGANMERVGSRNWAIRLL